MTPSSVMNSCTTILPMINSLRCGVIQKWLLAPNRPIGDREIIAARLHARRSVPRCAAALDEDGAPASSLAPESRPIARLPAVRRPPGGMRNAPRTTSHRRAAADELDDR